MLQLLFHNEWHAAIQYRGRCCLLVSVSVYSYSFRAVTDLPFCTANKTTELAGVCLPFHFSSPDRADFNKRLTLDSLIRLVLSR